MHFLPLCMIIRTYFKRLPPELQPTLNRLTAAQDYNGGKINMQMKKKILLFCLVSICFMAAHSQTTYHSAIGIRIGTGYSDLFSASYKVFLSGGPGAMELNLGVKPASEYVTGCCVMDNSKNTIMSFSGSYQYHIPIAAVPGLQWFIGGGFTLTNTFSESSDYSGIGFGLFPTGGADYKFGKIPLDVSVDIRPTFRIASPAYYNYENFYFPDFGFSARYTIN